MGAPDSHHRDLGGPHARAIGWGSGAVDWPRTRGPGSLSGAPDWEAERRGPGTEQGMGNPGWDGAGTQHLGAHPPRGATWA